MKTHFNFKHGHCRTALYRVWENMHTRCFNKNNKGYHRYGGRGITVCEEWRTPKTFLEWAVNNGWEKGLQIDRIDNDGNYCPENCRFVTPAENCRNKSSTKLSKGKAFLIREMYKFDAFSYAKLSKIFGVHKTAIHKIVHYETWV